MAIKKIMAEKLMTQTDLAKIAGLTKPSISRVLAKGTCTIKSCGKIAKALGVDLSEIVIEI
jgi:DNA-binding Xre family transcriptional regulator